VTIRQDASASDVGWLDFYTDADEPLMNCRDCDYKTRSQTLYVHATV